MNDKQKLLTLISNMQPRTLMYLRNNSFAELVAYINGFSMACEENPIGKFRRWLLKTKFNCEESNFSWCELVLMLFLTHRKKEYILDLELTDEEHTQAIQLIFSLLLEFLTANDIKMHNPPNSVKKENSENNKYVSLDMRSGSLAKDWLESAKISIASSNYEAASFPLKMAAIQFEQSNDLDNANKARALLKEVRNALRKFT